MNKWQNQLTGRIAEQTRATERERCMGIGRVWIEIESRGSIW